MGCNVILKFMLFRIFSVTPNIFSGLVLFVVIAIALIISLSIHELAHAYVADKLGDSTAKHLGRVTLDPRAHLDPTGTFLLLLFGFGWGKPVPVNFSNLDNPKRDSAIISFAGPLSNILLGTLFAGIYHLLGNQGLLGFLIQLIIQYNIIFAVFNLIPVHPLDGFKVVNGLLPEELSYQWIQMGQYGIWILLFLVLTGTIERIIFPISNLILQILQI